MKEPRLATANDMARALTLIKELALFEKELEQVELTLDELINDGFGESPKFRCFVVEVDDSIQGLALIYPRYSTWKGAVIHLEDLIVSKAYRGHGLGTKLFDAVVSYAHKEQVKRISWDVLNWNEPAIRFYEQKGARILRDWNVVQMDEYAIENYVNKLKN